jgi:pimeloyl-ACP methyl ester carboxylesterase
MSHEVRLPMSITRSRWLRALCGALVLGLAACTADTGDVSDEPTQEEIAASLNGTVGPETADALAAVPWTTIGAGVSYKKFGQGSDVVIVYGGYTAQDVFSQRWADQLVRDKLGDAGVGHIYAVRGPNQSGYANREIGNSKLVAHLAAGGRGAQASRVVVIAHSSGTYVATELLQDLHQSAPSTLAKVSLFNLDGGGLDASLVSRMAHTYFVYACDSQIGRCSHNASGMKSLAAEFASAGGGIKVNATGSGCSASASGGLWCMHDALITSRPHNPAMYDLLDDYTDFSTKNRASLPT